jgi:hypothetical protein
MATSAQSDSTHPLDLMPGWAWLFAAAVFFGTVGLLSLAALDILKNNCMTTHALCGKPAE